MNRAGPFTLLRTLTLCLGLTAASAHSQKAEQTMTKAYIVAEIEVIDAATYEGYKSAVAPIVSSYGGRYLARGGQTEAFEGQKPDGRVVILEFPSMTAAKSFLNSDEYQPVAAIRQKSTKSRLFVVEGMPQ